MMRGCNLDELERMAHARDLQPGRTLEMWQGRADHGPALVRRPADTEEVWAVLKEAADAGVQCVPWGAGSGVCGAAVASRAQWSLDLKRLAYLGDVDEATWTVEVGAGVLGQHLESALAERGWTCGHSPSSIGCSTVGGWAAARGAGQFSSRYGVFEDMVVGLDAVSPALGPFTIGLPGRHRYPTQPLEWLPLILGAEGQGVVLTSLRIRVWPLPRARWWRAYRFPKMDDALTAMRRVMQEELWPSVLRLYDPVDTLIGGKTRPRKERRASAAPGWFASWREHALLKPHLLSMPLALPRVINAAAGQLAGSSFLVAGWEGEPASVSALAEPGHQLLSEHGEDLGPDPAERWFHSRHAVSYKLMPFFVHGAFADTMEVACAWSRVRPVYDAVRHALRDLVVPMCHMSHAYPEGCSLYFSFAGQGDPQRYIATWDAALTAAMAAGANTTHHHGAGRLKARWASAELGAARRGFDAWLDTVDPARTLHDLSVEPIELPPARQGWTPEDGLARTVVDRPDALTHRRWRWASAAGPLGAARSPWQSDVVEVRGSVDGENVVLGRGPRSATGPDLRRWLMQHGEHVEVTLATTDDGAMRQMVRIPCGTPWSVACQLMRNDFRPSNIWADEQALYVGFRGVAAEALCQAVLDWSTKASGLIDRAGRVPWTAKELPAGAFIWCADDDPRACWATAQGVFRRPEEGETEVDDV